MYWKTHFSWRVSIYSSTHNKDGWTNLVRIDIVEVYRIIKGRYGISKTSELDNVIITCTQIFWWSKPTKIFVIKPKPNYLAQLCFLLNNRRSYGTTIKMTVALEKIKETML